MMDTAINLANLGCLYNMAPIPLALAACALRCEKTSSLMTSQADHKIHWQSGTAVSMQLKRDANQQNKEMPRPL